jgi:hypothetical protein
VRDGLLGREEGIVVPVPVAILTAPLIPRLLACALIVIPALASAGPPYTTDDPEPVEFHHWEVYLATSDQWSRDDGWSGTSPHVEVNYGVVPDVQLHVIAPLAWARPPRGPAQFGYGDTELGVKLRFVHEGDWIPQLGAFPLIEVPTGNASSGLGSGQTQVFLPLWLQKTFGPWTTYGGGGYPPERARATSRRPTIASSKWPTCRFIDGGRASSDPLPSPSHHTVAVLFSRGCLAWHPCRPWTEPGATGCAPRSLSFRLSTGG